MTSNPWFRHGLTARRPPLAYHPCLEELEGRCVPSLLPGNEFELAVPYTSPAAAAAPDGNFVVVSRGPYGSGTPVIIAQVNNADGTPLTGAFQVSQESATSQSNPTVAVDAQGDFVVTWSSTPGAGTVGSVYARLYDASGQAMGNEFQVNQETSGSQQFPSVAMDAQGDFVVTWQSLGEAGDTPGIFARLYNTAGTAQGNEFLVDQTTDVNQVNPAVAMDASGDFVVTWQTGTASNIAARLYIRGGTVGEAQFQVNQGTTDGGVSPQVAIGDGAYVIVWTAENQASSTSGMDVLARQFSIPLTPAAPSAPAVNNEFLVNVYTANDQLEAHVAMDAQGDFVVVWQSRGPPESSPGQPLRYVLNEDGDGPGIYARLFNASGVDLSSEFQVNETTNEWALNPAVVMDSAGDLTVVWSAYSESPSVFARQYAQSTIGYSFDAASGTLTINTADSNNAFTYTLAFQNHDFSLNGVQQNYNTVALSQVAVIAPGSGNTAMLQDPVYGSYPGNIGLVAVLGVGGGTLDRVDTSGNLHQFLQLAGFQTIYAYLGPADSGQLLGTSGMPAIFVTAGSYSYLTAGNGTYFSLIANFSVGAGAPTSVYAYAANPTDQVWHYDTNAMDSFVASGNAYSYMSGTDNGLSFFNEAVGFDVTYGISQYDKSIAYLIDSPGNDVFYGATTYSYLTRLSPQPGNPKSESRNPKGIRISKSETAFRPCSKGTRGLAVQSLPLRVPLRGRGEGRCRNFTALYEKGVLSSNGCYHTRRWSKTP